MRDLISEMRVVQLHPILREDCKDIVEKVEKGFPNNLAIRIVQGYRTVKEQNDLYKIGRSLPGKIVTKAKGGSSYHNYGLAVDFAIITDKKLISWDIRKDNDKDGTADWLEVVYAFEDQGWDWGGKWHSIKDYPHLQKTFGYTWQDLFRKYKDKDFLPGTRYLNL